MNWSAKLQGVITEERVRCDRERKSQVCLEAEIARWNCRYKEQGVIRERNFKVQLDKEIVR